MSTPSGTPRVLLRGEDTDGRSAVIETAPRRA